MSIGWLCLTALLGACGRQQPVLADMAGCNVIVVVIDALRADHLGAYGYHRDTTGFIDSIADEGIVFEYAVSSSSFTQESVATLLTGMLPSRSGAVGWGARPPFRLRTLAEYFKRAGYRTAMLSDTPVLSARQFSQGFEVTEILNEQWDHSGGAGELAKAAVRFAGTHRTEPIMMYLHFLDPHGPYEPTDEDFDRFATRRIPNPVGVYSQARRRCHTLIADGFGPGEARFEDMVLRYDAEIAGVDSAIRGLFDGLQNVGVLDNSLVVITSDHGEEFLEHRFVEHAWTLYEESLRVPLILWGPGVQPSRVSGRVSTADVFPTILELAGISYEPQGLDGRAVTQRHKRGLVVDVSPRMQVAELLIQDRNLLRAVTDGRWKYVAAWKWLPPETRPAALADKQKRLPVDTWGPAIVEELYDLEADPAELNDLAKQNPAELARLRLAMQQYLASCDRSVHVPRPDASPTAEETRALRALGYLTDS